MLARPGSGWPGCRASRRRCGRRRTPASRSASPLAGRAWRPARRSAATPRRGAAKQHGAGQQAASSSDFMSGDRFVGKTRDFTMPRFRAPMTDPHRLARPHPQTPRREARHGLDAHAPASSPPPPARPAAGAPSCRRSPSSAARNAGKSTAINTLTQQKRLAFASKTPGRTQHINLFELGPQDAPDALLADLPGYGYAAVRRGAKLRWQQVMANYLAARRRPARRGAAGRLAPRLHRARRHPARVRSAPRVEQRRVKLLVLLTKADKLNRSEAGQGAVALRELQAGGGEVQTVLGPEEAGRRRGRRPAVAVDASQDEPQRMIENFAAALPTASR